MPNISFLRTKSIDADDGDAFLAFFFFYGKLSQGFLPVDASILDVEVWGLGGTKAKNVQASYKKREELFTEQRRKVVSFNFGGVAFCSFDDTWYVYDTVSEMQVDLKTFTSWEDSPEKMMMDMVSDPNRVRREDR